MSFPFPDQPLPEGWVFIEHPDVGRAENPVSRDSLSTWIRAGWTQAPDEPAADTTAESSSVQRRRAATAAADQVKE